MAAASDFERVFDRLRAIMLHHAANLVIVRDAPGNLYIDTAHIMPNKKPMWFGGVTLNKRYVSYHLMAVYVNPRLLQAATPELRKRMQGKSCFNFKTVDEALFAELDSLTAAAIAFYRDAGYAN